MEECTNEEIGVGAAIAAGNHEENGTWALFVILPINRSIQKVRDVFCR